MDSMAAIERMGSMTIALAGLLVSLLTSCHLNGLTDYGDPFLLVVQQLKYRIQSGEPKQQLVCGV